jgi:hypothetical protein
VVVELMVMFYEIFVYDVVYLDVNNEEQVFSIEYVHRILHQPSNGMMM